MTYMNDSRLEEYMNAIDSSIKILNETCSGMNLYEKYTVCSFDLEIIRDVILNIVENIYNNETGLVEKRIGYSVDLRLFSTEMPNMAMKLGLYIGNWLKNSPFNRQ